MTWVESVIGVEASRPEFTVADVFRQHWDAYCERYPATREQKRAAHAIMDCRTAVLGGHIDVCDTCDWMRISYNS